MLFEQLANYNQNQENRSWLSNVYHKYVSSELIFPLKTLPLNYKNGFFRAFDFTASSGTHQATFKSNRDNGARLHAARDLYTEPYAEIIAMTHGKVIDVAPFYMGTSQITIEHTYSIDGENKMIVRYGEVDPLSIAVKIGDWVNKGQVIGKTGKLIKNGKPLMVINGKVVYMLHLEIYTGKLGNNVAVNKLTTSGNKFTRRADLIDPIDILKLALDNTNETYELSYNTNTPKNFDWSNEVDFFAPEADPILFYEDVKIKQGETIVGLAAEYGFDPDDWREIWDDPKNAALKASRKLSTSIQAGDTLYVPIKWRIKSKSLRPRRLTVDTFMLFAERSGKEGLRLDWVQTVYGHNQAKFMNSKPFPAFSVDEPTWDNTPFYATQNDFDKKILKRTQTRDTPWRYPPSLELGTTTWRAVTSLCVITGKRVSIWDTFVWGIDFQPNGVNKAYPIRPASQYEIDGHLNLLRKKSGSANVPFSELGWTFLNRNPVIV